MIEGDLISDGAVVREFGPPVTKGLVHLVGGFPSEVDAGLGVAAIEPAGHGAKTELATAVIVEGNVAGAEKVDELALPEFRLSRAPASGWGMSTPPQYSG